MPVDLETVSRTMPQLIPFVGTLGIEYTELDDARAVCRIDDRPEYRNHVGGPHAGVMFTLAETASGALVLRLFGDLLERVTPLPVEATIQFLKVALGPVTAVATSDVDREAALAVLDGGERPEFDVTVALTTGEGDTLVETGALTVRWTLRVNR